MRSIIFFIISSFACYLLVKSQQQLLPTSIILEGIPKSTKDFILNNCESFTRRRNNLLTISQSSDIEIYCGNLQTDVIMIKRCHPSCINPTTCRKMIRFHNEAILFTEQVKDQEGNIGRLLLPKACQCVVKNRNLVKTCFK